MLKRFMTILFVTVLCMGVSIAVAQATNEPFESPMPTVTPAPFVTPAPPVVPVSYALAAPTATPGIIPTPVPPEKCSHPMGFDVQVRFRYRSKDSAYHWRYKYMQKKCITCGYVFPEDLIDEEVIPHPADYLEWTDWHNDVGRTHRFAYICTLCYGTIKSATVPCYGEPHVSNPLK